MCPRFSYLFSQAYILFISVQWKHIPHISIPSSHRLSMGEGTLDWSSAPTFSYRQDILHVSFADDARGTEKLL